MSDRALKPVTKILKRVDKTGNIAKALESIQSKAVLVGIPAESASRSGDELNNAELGYMLSHGVRAGAMRSEMDASQQAGKTYSQALEAYLMANGDPLWHIPPRPFLEPALEASMEQIQRQQEKILKAALDGDIQLAEAEQKKLGMLAQSIVKKWFTDPRNGWEPNAPATIAAKKSDKPNIDTSAMRNAITYVIRGKDA